MFIKDPCGISCIIVTYIAVFYADYVVIRWIILETMQNTVWGPIHVVLFNTVVFLLAMSHLRAALTDPGTVPLPQARLDFSDIHSPSSGDGSDITGDWSVCARCETYRPPRAHHCRVCGRCVRRMDHHCPWINNCVGERNQRHFVLFLLYVAVLAVYSGAMVVSSWLAEEQQETIQQKQNRIEPSKRSLHCVILLLESALFGMFVTAILFEQLQAILGDETGVEAVQSQGRAAVPHRLRKPRMALMSEVCGRTHPILWLLPCSLAKSHKHHTGGLIHHHV